MCLLLRKDFKLFALLSERKMNRKREVCMIQLYNVWMCIWMLWYVCQCTCVQRPQRDIRCLSIFTSKIPLRQGFSPEPGTHFCASLISHQANCLHLFSPNHWGLQDHVVKARFCECEKDLNWSSILVQKCSFSLRYLPILPFAYFLMKLFVFL